MSESDQNTEPATGLALLVSDVKRFAGFAAKLGAIIAIVCHLLPPHYRAICEQLAAVCHGGG